MCGGTKPQQPAKPAVLKNPVTVADPGQADTSVADPRRLAGTDDNTNGGVTGLSGKTSGATTSVLGG